MVTPRALCLSLALSAVVPSRKATRHQVLAWAESRAHARKSTTLIEAVEGARAKDSKLLDGSFLYYATVDQLRAVLPSDIVGTWVILQCEWQCAINSTLLVSPVGVGLLRSLTGPRC